MKKPNIMKKYLTFLFIITAISIFSQEQKINGFPINAPVGFEKFGDLQWRKDNDFILLQSIKANTVDNESFKKYCAEPNRGLKFLECSPITFNDKEHYICVQESDTGLLMVTLLVYYNSYTYTIISGAEINEDYEDAANRAMYNLGYMNTKLSLLE